MAELMAPTELSTAVPTVPAGQLCLYPDSTALTFKVKTPAGNIMNALGQGPIPWIDVTSYGATGNSTTDDTAAINSAIAAAVALTAPAGSQRGCVVYFPEGIYLVSSALTSPNANGIVFMGAGRGASTIYVATAFATGDVLAFTSGKAYCEVRNLQFFAQGTRSSGAFINTNGATDIIISDNVLTGPFVGINVSGSSIKVRIRNTEINSIVGTTGVGISVNNGAAGDTYIGPGVVMSNATQPLAGIQILATGHTSCLEVNTTKCITGLLIAPGASQTATYVFIDHCLWDSCSTNCMSLNATTATSVIESVFMQNAWASGTTSGGAAGLILTGVAGGIIDDIHFVNCRFLNNQTHGVQHGFGNNVTFSECTMAGNSQASSGTSDGINIAAGISKFVIIGCTIGTAGTSQAATQRFGVNVLAGASNSYTITNNNFTSNVTANISDLGAPTGLTQKLVMDNIGGSVQGGISSTTAASGAINTAETGVAGGTNNAVFPANSIKVGTVIRAILTGTCTATVANASTFTLRFGTAGTTGDASIATGAVTSAATGTNIPFRVIVDFVCTSVGTTGTLLGSLAVTNSGATGLAAQGTTVVALTVTATLNTTVASYLTVTYKSAATTTTSTFSAPCYIEVVKS
jgi:Pectate lyase superfamily protein